MTDKNRTPKPIMDAAVAMLMPTNPGITAEILQEALNRAIDTVTVAQFEKPLTRKEACKALAISMPTLNRWMDSGRVERIKIGERAVRISAQSIRSLLSGQN